MTKAVLGFFILPFQAAGVKEQLVSSGDVIIKYIGWRRNRWRNDMKNKLLFPMNLQFFAEPPADGGQETPPADEQTPPDGEVKKEESTGKTFSRDDVAKMIAAETKKARTEWEKELEAKEVEAKKLAKMNAEEKLQHQLQQKEDEINELREKQALAEMSKEASKMFSENELPVDDELLSLVVSADAEQTKQAVNTVLNFASKIKKTNARQTPPSAGGQFQASDDKPETAADMAKNARIIK